ncbi:MAG TPA: hypothetical protein DCQ30_03350 [Acidimicrobiaceae bacterium]|nr:hypothetical protein [Acidimicrobiaceae bacterium]
MAERGALVTSWGAATTNVPPAKGMDVFARALTWYDELTKEGRISGYRVYASTTRDRGMIVAEGDAAELAKLSVEPASTTMLALASAVVNDVSAEIYIGGSPDDVVGFYTRAIETITEAGLAE